MKLDIIGSVGSGKSTLAKTISKEFGIPYYEKDNIVWERTANGDRKREPEERDEIYKKILESENWIVEGSPRKVLKESFEVCDYIIFLDISFPTRCFRVIRRWIRQRSGKETYNTAPTFQFLIYNIKWLLQFNRDRKKLVDELSQYKDRFRRFKKNEDVMEFLRGRYL